MTTLNQYITQIPMTPEYAKIRGYANQVSNMFYEIYCQSFRAIGFLLDYERINRIKDAEIKINDKLTEINKLYRTEIAGVSADYKRVNIVVWSYAGKYLTDVIGERFDFTFNKRNYKIRAKMNATHDKVKDAFIIALAFLFAKNPVVYEYQIQATFVKLITDFFDFDSVTKLQGATAIYYDVRDNLDITAVYQIINDLGLQPDKPKTMKTEKKQKIALPSKEDFEAWLACGQYKRNQLQDIIATQYNISRRTVQRLLADYGLSRKYTKLTK